MARTKVIIDASPVGLGGELIQIQKGVEAYQKWKKVLTNRTRGTGNSLGMRSIQNVSHWWGIPFDNRLQAFRIHLYSKIKT